MVRDDGKTYCLKCNGECAPGFDKEHVIEQFANLFSVTAKDVEKLFSGEMQFEKRNLNYFTAKQYHKAFSKIGVISNLFLQDKKIKDSDVESENPLGATVCPKCGNQQDQNEVCRQCGIYFHRYMETELRKRKKKSVSEDVRKSTDDEVPDHVEKKKIKDIRRAKLGIRYGSIFVIGVFILDEILQMRNADIGYRPYVLSTVFFIYGCWYYASSKGYSSYLGGILGMANMAGLIILFFLPDRTASVRKKGLIKSIVVVGFAVVVAVLWWDSYQSNQTAIQDYLEYSKSIGFDRHVYPSEILDSEPELLNTEFEKVTALVDSGFDVLNENEFRPGDIIYVGDILMGHVASFFIWIQYQQYLHYTMTGELPDHLQSRKVKIFNDSFQRQISAFVQSNREHESNKAFEKVYYAWTDNCFAWDLTSGECLDTDYVCFGLNTRLWKLKEYFFEVEQFDMFYGKHDKKPSNARYPEIPEMNKSIISSIEIKNKSIIELKIASESMGEISGKLLVMAYYKQPTYSGSKIILQTKFVCIGGDVPNKYLMGDMSVFLYW